MAVTAGRVGAAIRDEFPIFAHTTYLNSCSQGALSHRVRAAYEEYVDGWDANGAEWAAGVKSTDTTVKATATPAATPASQPARVRLLVTCCVIKNLLWALL